MLPFVKHLCGNRIASQQIFAVLNRRISALETKQYKPIFTVQANTMWTQYTTPRQQDAAQQNPNTYTSTP